MSEIRSSDLKLIWVQVPSHQMFKSDKTLVDVVVNGERIHTGLKKFGAMLGDNVEIGCNTVMNPGTVIGRMSNVYPTSMVRGFIPEKSIYKKRGEVVKKRRDDRLMKKISAAHMLLFITLAVFMISGLLLSVISSAVHVPVWVSMAVGSIVIFIPGILYCLVKKTSADAGRRIQKDTAGEFSYGIYCPCMQLSGHCCFEYAVHVFCRECCPKFGCFFADDNKSAGYASSYGRTSGARRGVCFPRPSLPCVPQNITAGGHYF